MGTVSRATVRTHRQETQELFHRQQQEHTVRQTWELFDRQQRGRTVKDAETFSHATVRKLRRQISLFFVLNIFSVQFQCHSINFGCVISSLLLVNMPVSLMPGSKQSHM